MATSMKELASRMNMKFATVEGAHVMKKVNLGLSSADTLCFICSEMNIDLSEISDQDFDSASIILGEFCNAADETTGYTVSVWFDDENI